MNYQWHYDSLIRTRKERVPDETVYYEKHHIIMRSMGGADLPENLVMLTAREHFLAHWLLWRIHRNLSTSAAFHSMCNFKNVGQKHASISSRAYAEAREAFSRKISEKMIGNTNCLGYKHTDEARKNMSIAQINMTDEHRLKIGLSRIGHEVTQSTREKISKKNAISQLGNTNGSGNRGRVPWNKRFFEIVKLECLNCKVAFETLRTYRKYCSKSCAAKHRTRNKM